MIHTTFNQDSFALTHFEGPLDFLLCLLQKEEIDIYDISIQELIKQFIEKNNHPFFDNVNLHKGTEFIGRAAYLIWLKSKALLPDEDNISESEEVIEDPHFEVIYHLIDYCKFKQAAKELTSRQEKQQACYFRGIDLPEWKKPSGIEHISLEDLSSLFRTILKRTNQNKNQIDEEIWRVSDKMLIIRQLLKERQFFPLKTLFSLQQARQEIIVIFLALLELMKVGELGIGWNEKRTLLIFAKKE